MQARQLCLYGWDHPELVAALTDTNTTNGASVASSSGSSSRSTPGSRCYNLESKALLQLRLEMLNTLDLTEDYLNLATRGQLWSEAVMKLLQSPDRSVCGMLHFTKKVLHSDAGMLIAVHGQTVLLFARVLHLKIYTALVQCSSSKQTMTCMT